MKTTLKTTIIVAAALFITIKAGMACKREYSNLKDRYVSEAKGRGLAFINAMMY